MHIVDLDTFALLLLFSIQDLALVNNRQSQDSRQKTLIGRRILVELQRPIRTDTGEIIGIASETNARGRCRVIVEHLDQIPLFRLIDTNVCSSHTEIHATLVEDEITHFVTIVQGDRFEVLQFTQIPQLDRRVFSSRGQIIT